MTSDLAVRWHVPRERRLTFRFQLIRLACTATILATLVYLLVEPDQHIPALLVVGGLVALTALWQWWQSRAAQEHPPNVWLDGHGFHWLSADGREHLLGKEAIVNYWLGFDEQTQLALPSLTFLLQNDYLSQPIEMHPPVNAQQLRDWFRDHWGLAGCAHLPEPPVRHLSLYTEFDDHRQLWLFQGTTAELKALQEVWLNIANTEPLPPEGARPKEIYLEFGAERGMMLALAPFSWIEFSTFSVPPDRLLELAQALAAFLSSSEQTFEQSWQCDSDHGWKLMFHRLSDPASSGDNTSKTPSTS